MSGVLLPDHGAGQWHPPLIVLGGPTATGKTGLALDTAVALMDAGVEAAIVNADAMQLYRGMDVGTAKTPVAERRDVPHYLFDRLDVTERASVADYQTAARAAIMQLQRRGVVPLLVGGSGLYIEAVIHELDFPGSDPDVRERLQAELAEHGAEPLLDRLREADPEAAARLADADDRRLVRAVEVLEITGHAPQVHLPDPPIPWRPYQMIVIDALDREALAQRIHERAEHMWGAGLAGETDRLLAAGLRGSPTAGRAIGYMQSIQFLDGELTAAQAIDEIAAATVRLAKRQRTWFRRYDDATVLDADGIAPDSGKALAATVIADLVMQTTGSLHRRRARWEDEEAGGAFDAIFRRLN